MPIALDIAKGIWQYRPMTKTASQITTSDQIKSGGRYRPVIAITDAPAGQVAITTAYSTDWHAPDAIVQVRKGA